MGSVMAFQNYSIFRGIFNSPWAGWENFRFIFGHHAFIRVLTNTAIIAGGQIFVGFPVPIILALLLNGVRLRIFKRLMQTIYYLPHFISWPILAVIIFQVLSLNGPVNIVRSFLGMEPELFMQRISFFRPLVIISQIWKDAGWGSIVFLAALAGIDPNLYEAAEIEGAGRFKKLIYITLPLLVPTIIVMFLLRIGNFLNLGFEQVWVLVRDMTLSVGDILPTFIYRSGIVEGNFSTTTAAGLFQSLFGLILLLACNYAAKKTAGRGIF